MSARPPQAGGLRRRRPGTVIPNEVIFMRRDVCGKVKGSGRRGNREARLTGGKAHRREGDRSLQWLLSDPGLGRDMLGRARGGGGGSGEGGGAAGLRSAWPSSRGSGWGLQGSSVQQSPGPPRAQLQLGPNSWEGAAPAPHRAQPEISLFRQGLLVVLPVPSPSEPPGQFSVARQLPRGQGGRGQGVCPDPPSLSQETTP